MVDLDQLWEQQQEGEIIIDAILDDVLENAMRELESRALGRRAVSAGVRMAVHEMTKALNVLLMDFDLGETDIVNDSTWRIDCEPVPSLIDSWSRGAVRAREKKELGPRIPSPPASEIGAGSQFGGSRVSTSSRRGVTSRKSSGNDSMPSLPEKQGPPVARSRTLPQDRSRDSHTLMTPAEESAARRAADEREDQRRLEELRTSMRGKEYTTDAAGNVIPIENPNPERLPPYKLYPGIGLHTGENDDTPAPKRGSKAAKAKGAAPGAHKLRVELGESSYKPLTSLQPPLMESLEVREGVTLRASDAIKEGASRPVDPQHMSRKDFEIFSRTAQAKAEAALANDPAFGPVDPTINEPPALEDVLSSVTTTSLNAPHQQPKDWGRNPPSQEVVLPRQPQGKPAGMRARGSDAIVEGTSGNFIPAFRERGGTAVKNRVPPPLPPTFPPTPRAGA